MRLYVLLCSSLLVILLSLYILSKEESSALFCGREAGRSDGEEDGRQQLNNNSKHRPQRPQQHALS